jgi:DNA polymerase-1
MLVGLDTEYTFGSVTNRKGRLHGDITTMQPVCACLYFEDGRDIRITDNWASLQEVFDDSKYTFIVHGVHAESLFCDRVGLRFPKHFRDTQLIGLLILHMLAFHLPGGAYTYASLANLTSRLGIGYIWNAEKDLIRTSIMLGTHVADFGMAQVLDYCAADARACLQLFSPLCAEMSRRCGPNAERNLVELYQPYALLMAGSARKGVHFDVAAWNRLMEFSPGYRQGLLSVLREWGYAHDGDGLGQRGFERVLANLGLRDSWPRTPTGLLSTVREDLKALRHQHVVIEAAYDLVNFDAFMKLNIGANVDNDGRIRCNILTLAQHTSRNSTTSPNLMGIPGKLRPLLLPEPGCKFVHFDFSQQEPSIAGYLSGDLALLRDFAEGDVYVNAGMRMGVLRPGMRHDVVTRIRNQVLKPLMLAILYGKGPASLARDVPCSYNEAVLHLHQFERAYPQLFRWIQGYVQISLQRHWAENIIGFRAAFDSGATNQGHVARSCQNFPIQASAAACFQLTGVMLGDFGADIRLPLHDAYLINVPDDPREIDCATAWVKSATRTATNQLFPGLADKCKIEVCDRFAKNGCEASLEQLIASLKGELCGVQ